MSTINPSVISHADEFHHRYTTAQPFHHVVIPDFLDSALCADLLAEFPQFEDRLAVNEMGQIGGKAVRTDVADISPAYRELDRYLQGQTFLDFISRVTGIPDLLYDADYIGGGTHENRDGQSLDAHVDFNYHPRTRWHRRLNLIVYLNPEWDEAWGGALELHSDPWSPATDRATAILPLFNCCAIFETTETSWHGFAQIALPEDKKQLSRKSFAIYLYTRERPPEQMAPTHATVYVPQALPSEWSVGHTLSEADVSELEDRFGRIRSQLLFLYDREKQFGVELDARGRALDEARNAQRLKLQGYATQPRGTRGIWPDDWAGNEVTASFVPSRTASELLLELWAPRQFKGGPELRIELDGVAFTQVLRPGMRTPVRLTQRMPAGREISLSIRSAHSFVPGADGTSDDQRALSFKVLGAILTH